MNNINEEKYMERIIRIKHILAKYKLDKEKYLENIDDIYNILFNNNTNNSNKDTK